MSNIKSIKQVIVYSDPQTKRVALGPFPQTDKSRAEFKGWGDSWGGCNQELQRGTVKSRQARVVLETWHMVVRHGFDPQEVHKVMLGVEEYHASMAWDMPGVTQ